MEGGTRANKLFEYQHALHSESLWLRGRGVTAEYISHSLPWKLSSHTHTQDRALSFYDVLLPVISAIILASSHSIIHAFDSPLLSEEFGADFAVWFIRTSFADRPPSPSRCHHQRLPRLTNHSTCPSTPASTLHTSSADSHCAPPLRSTSANSTSTRCLRTCNLPSRLCPPSHATAAVKPCGVASAYEQSSRCSRTPSQTSNAKA